MTPDLEELLEEIHDTPYGETRVSMAERAVRLADETQDIGAQHEARHALLAAGVFGGFPEKSLVAFSWLVAATDRDPDRFPASRAIAGLFLGGVDLLWCYKWIIQFTDGFAQISREQIERTLDEMAERYRTCGFSLRPVWMNRARVCIALDGDADRVGAYFAKWKDSPRDLYADCPACEQHFRVEMELFRDDVTEAMRAAEPILNGEMRCAEIPQLTWLDLLVPLWEAGEAKRADQFAEAAWESCADDRDTLQSLANLAELRLAQGEAREVLRLVKRYARWIRETRAQGRIWRWFVLAELAIEREADEASDMVDVARQLGLEVRTGSTSDVARAFSHRADAIVEAFDRRNGNELISGRAAELRAKYR